MTNNKDIRFEVGKILMNMVSRIVSDAKQAASWSSKIPNSISGPEPLMIEANRVSTRLLVDLDKAPMAMAFEYGSGIHSTIGERGTYEIVPKNFRFLVFPVGNPPVGRWPKYSGDLDEGDKIYLNLVNHPGVVANPFLQPAIADNAEKFLDEIAEAGLDAFVDNVKVEIIR